MQTLRRRTSPCKYKNDPSRFLGEGITFKAKLIGILEVNEARGDKMCQDALNDLKTAIRAAGEHKQRITIGISIDGLRLRDEKTGDCLYHHPVHKISFIAQDMSDSRAFGYIFGSPDTGHRFFGIKTEKTASQVVISMRDLFQVVFELKKKEIEMAKHHTDQHHGAKYGSTSYMDSLHFPKDDADQDKSRGKYSHLLKPRCGTAKLSEASVGSASDAKGSEAIADLLDLEHELNSIQQGISQMEKITPSDPFGPLPKTDPYDPFDDSFAPGVDNAYGGDRAPAADPPGAKDVDPGDVQKHSASFFASSAVPGKNNFFSQFSPGIGKSKMDEGRWYDQETESLFDDSVGGGNAEPTSSPVALPSSVSEAEPTGGRVPTASEWAEGKKSPMKTDFFMELDPLGTGRVKPYVDKKDFFQELKNPPKKVLKEMITEPVPTTGAESVSSIYFPASFRSGHESDLGFGDSAAAFIKSDPFDEGDPFEKTDPFQQEFASGFSDFPAKVSLEGIFDDGASSWNFEKTKRSNVEEAASSRDQPSNAYTSSGLRVSLPPEKASETSPVPRKSSASPNSPDDPKALRRKRYQALRQSTSDVGDESPVHEEPFIKCKVSGFGGSSSDAGTRSPYKDRFGSTQSPTRRLSSRHYSGMDVVLDATTPDPPPRAKAALFLIKPPPLPPKKLCGSSFKPPARPPLQVDDGATSHYVYLQGREAPSGGQQQKEELKCVKLKKQLYSDGYSVGGTESKKQQTESAFPVLPPPPQRKASAESNKSIPTSRKEDGKGKVATGGDDSILNLKLNQLDSTGLENLAATLGIPSENVYSMTLQDLTKMLSQKYMPPTSRDEVQDTERPASDTFEVDFDANFAKPTEPAYDKYAAFKELIENETKEPESGTKGETESGRDTKEEETTGRSAEEGGTKEAEVASGAKATEVPEPRADDEEDRYAALRQLSLNAAAGESARGGLEKDGGQTKEKQQTTGDSETTDIREKREPEADVGADDVEGGWPSKDDEWAKAAEKGFGNDSQVPNEAHLFPLVDEFSEPKPECAVVRENWETFEKSGFRRTIARKSAENANERENSPFSSDGREDLRETSFRWHESLFDAGPAKDLPWGDEEDESWDEYSAKESFCSDESSHEERSPEARRSERLYEKAAWGLRGHHRGPAKERSRGEMQSQWPRRDKWLEETEDEFEESWRKQRERKGSCDPERKSFRHGNACDEYKMRYEWCNSRETAWEESERRCQFYSNRRKRSESDNEYRKRCDSDTSDKECVWSFQKNYPEGRGRAGKQKPYHGSGHGFRECPEHYHEPRSKHRSKGGPQKRPSSASESKRNYEKLFPFGECKGGYLSKRESDGGDHGRYQHSGKDPKHRGLEYDRCYSCDRKSSSSHRGMPVCGRSVDSAGKLRPTNPGEGGGQRCQQFDSEGEGFEKRKQSESEQSLQDFPKSPERSRWAAANGKTEGDAFCPQRGGRETAFVCFGDEASNPEAQGTNRTQMPKAGRQEPAALLRKSDSINIFSRDNDPFEGDDFFSSVS